MTDQAITLTPAPYRIRAWKDGQSVIDTDDAKFAHGVRHYMIWMFPREAVKLPREAIIAEHDGHVAIDWDAVDEWWEEDEPVAKLPRDMRHRVEARRSSRHVVVKHDGVLIADSHGPTVVAETGLGNRYYLPRGDVRFELLRRAERTSWCPYKGLANYYDVHIDGTVLKGALWTYEQPIADAAPTLAGLIGIWHEKLDVQLDGKSLGE